MIPVEYSKDTYEVSIPTRYLNKQTIEYMKGYSWVVQGRLIVTHFLGFYMFLDDHNRKEFQIPEELEYQYTKYKKRLKNLESIKQLSGEKFQHAEESISKSEFLNDLIQRVELNPNYKLTTHQKIGSLFLYFSKGALLCDEMGLGKTLTTFSTFQIIRYKEKTSKKQKMIYITKVSLIENVVNDIGKMMPDLNLLPFAKKSTKSLKKINELDFDVLITNLDKFRSNQELFASLFQKLTEHEQLGMLVVDECTSLKRSWDGSFSKMTLNFMFLVDKYYDQIKYRIGISGTPIENSISDIHNLYYFVDRSIIGTNYEWFVFNFCKLKYQRIRRFGKWIPQVVGFSGAKNLNLLKLFVRHAMIRRTHADVPEFSMVKIPVYLSSEDKKEYNRILSESESDDMEKTEIIHILRKFLNGCKSKINMLLEVLNKTTNKDIIYTKYIENAQTPMITGVTEAKFPRKVLVINGENKDKRGGIIQIEKDFKDEYDVLATTDCLSHGANFQFANRVVHMDLPFTKSVFDQRNGRIRRIGQTQDIYWVIIYVADSFEEDLLNKIMSKGKIGDSMSDKLYTDSEDEIKVKALKVERMK